MSEPFWTSFQVFRVCHKCAVRIDTRCDFVSFLDTFRHGFRAGLVKRNALILLQPFPF